MQKFQRDRQRRYGFTINNPFITDDIMVIPNWFDLTEAQRNMRHIEHDYSFIHDNKYDSLFDFAITQYDLKKDEVVVDTVIGERCFFKDYLSAQEYFKKIDFIDYVCFQYEKGESGNLHLQGFMRFNKPMDFHKVRAIFPTIHLDRCYGSNHENREYCMKPDTKVDGYDFFEFGNFVEEAERTDMNAFRDDVKNKKTIAELFDKYPHITLTSLPRIIMLQQELKKAEFKNIVRDLHTTYIYGKADAGKTTYPSRVLGYSPMDIGKITDYKSGKFDEYNNQDIILFDEFYSQIDITAMNDILDGQPRELPARYANRQACYTKAFIISNYPLDEQYKKARAEGKQPSYEGFVRRIHEIIYMPDRNLYIWQKGAPTPETIAKLNEQGAKYEILTEQMRIETKGEK